MIFFASAVMMLIIDLTPLPIIILRLHIAIYLFLCLLYTTTTLFFVIINPFCYILNPIVNLTRQKPMVVQILNNFYKIKPSNRTSTFIFFTTGKVSRYGTYALAVFVNLSLKLHHLSWNHLSRLHRIQFFGLLKEYIYLYQSWIIHKLARRILSSSAFL